MVVQKEKKKTGYKGDIRVKYDSALKRQRQEDGEFEATLGSKQIESSKERGRKEEKSTVDKAVPLLAPLWDGSLPRL